MYVTLTERKAAKVAAMTAAVEQLAVDLAVYARRYGGRFILFGSAARGQLRYDSDVDVLTDFPPDHADQAWEFAEERAYALDLKPDIHMLGWTGARLRERIVKEGRVLSRTTVGGQTCFGRSTPQCATSARPS